LEKESVEEEAADETSNITLPDVPTAEPTDDGPIQKKQKSNDDQNL
jgi:hypothetical protein